VKQPAEGHASKANSTAKKFVRECRLPEGGEAEYSAGDEISVSIFSEVKYVDVSGISKGKGFAGVMKRHGFGGFPGSHGTERKHRAPGSISSYASDAGHGGNLKKGKKMAGRMGGKRVTTKNHSVVSIDTEKNILVVKGAVPGPCGSYVEVRTAKTKN
jgi:large subunit ribosomal protein L3